VNTVFFLIAWLSVGAWAQSPSEIIEQARNVQEMNNGIQQIKMVLTSRNGATRERRFEMRIKKTGDVVKSYVRFSHPTDVAGTQLVMVDHPGQVDEQILYLPALKRTTRIAGRARSGAFMGSDFAYEDLEMSAGDEASHALVSEDEQAWVIDTTPAPSSSYGRLRAHVSKADYLPRTVEFFDKKGKALKVLKVLQTTTEGSTILPTHSVMKNLQRGTSTALTIESWRLDLPDDEIPDETFTAGFLERNG
jgi:hypothetical protein